MEKSWIFCTKAPTLLENGSISINWLIDYGLAFSRLCYLLSLNCYLLLSLNKTKNTVTFINCFFPKFHNSWINTKCLWCFRHVFLSLYYQHKEIGWSTNQLNWRESTWSTFNKLFLTLQYLTFKETSSRFPVSLAIY